jgi:heat shock protein HslJ
LLFLQNYTIYIDMKTINLALFTLLAAVLFGACAGAPATTETPAVSLQSLFGREWLLTAVIQAGSPTAFTRAELDDMGASDAFTLTISAEAVSGKAFPNRYRGPYTAGEGSALTIGPVAGTLMAAFKEPQGLTESQYYRLLANVTRWNYTNDQLELITTNDEGLEMGLIYSKAETL